MNLVSSAGVLSRRIGIEPAAWRSRVRALLRRPGSAPDKVGAEKIADTWIAEFGDEAAWNAERKVAELQKWGDRDGARIWTEVLKIIGERSRVRTSSVG